MTYPFALSKKATVSNAVISQPLGSRSWRLLCLWVLYHSGNQYPDAQLRRGGAQSFLEATDGVRNMQCCTVGLHKQHEVLKLKDWSSDI